jgi:hypothetical protein
MERVGEHPIPAGPLAVRWLAYDLPELRAGAETTVRVALQNAGTATWRSRRLEGVKLSYHWLDDRGNAIVWDGPRADLERPIAPGEEVEVAVLLRAPQPPGRYRLAFDLVEELRFWFAEVGSSPLELDVEVAPRISERRLAVVVHGGRDDGTSAALAAQEEPFVDRDSVATAHLVCACARCPRRRLRCGRRLDRDRRPRLPPVGTGGRTQSSLRAPAPAAVAPQRHRAGRARRAPGLRRGRRTVDLRRPHQTSTATRSSTRVKTKAPSASATTAATAR